MFFNIIYKSKIWQKCDPKSRNIRVFLLGGFFYLTFHSYLNSRYMNDYPYLLKYKKYFYYLLIFDLTTVTLIMSFQKDKKKIKKKKQKNLHQPQYINPQFKQILNQLQTQQRPTMFMPPLMKSPPLNQPIAKNAMMKPGPEMKVLSNRTDMVEKDDIPIYKPNLEEKKVLKQDEEEPEKEAEIPIYA